MTIEIKTQAELDQQIEKGESDFRFVVAGSFQIKIGLGIKVSVSAELSHLISIEAWGSSRVEAWESSRVVARESSSVVARESSSVVAQGFVSLVAFGGTLKLSAKCHAFIRSTKAKVTGGIKTNAIIKTPREWCDFYGVEVKNGFALLYKSVFPDFFNAQNRTVQYLPGSMPEANDWDGGKQECGCGLHFSPCVSMALEFHNEPNAKYVGCWVALKDMAVHPDGSMPQKCKARRVAKPIFEVDRDGKPVKP